MSRVRITCPACGTRTTCEVSSRVIREHERADRVGRIGPCPASQKLYHSGTRQ